jgi:predicted nucleic acid-binding protein
VRWLLALARHEGVLITPAHTLNVSPDEADNRFLECAEAAAAQFLITGNIKHYPREFRTTRIVTARQFVSQTKVQE